MKIFKNILRSKQTWSKFERSITLTNEIVCFHFHLESARSKTGHGNTSYGNFDPSVDVKKC